MTDEKTVAVPVSVLKKWKEALEPFWFSSDGEGDEDNNDGVIETSREIESYIDKAGK
jgi:hypothetical protein